MEHHGNEPFRGRNPHPRLGIESAQWKVAAILVIATIGAVAAWSASEAGLERTGLYFVAIPGALAVAVTLLPTFEGKETMFGPIRATTIAILTSALIIREGFICVLMASPFVLLVVALASSSARRNDKRDGRARAIVLLPLLLAGGAEGVAFDLPTRDVASEVRMLDAGPAEVGETLAGSAVLPTIEPLLFRLPFPMPVDVTNEGTDLGDRQIVTFEAGSLELMVEERSDTRVQWGVVADTTPIAGWYAVETITITWQAVDDAVELRVDIAYERQLSPAIYFAPLGRFGMGEMAEVLADMVEQNL